GKAAVKIDLAHVRRNGVDLAVVGNAAAAGAVPALDTLEETVRDRQIHAVLVVRGRGEHFPLFAQPQAPGVIARRSHKFHLRPIGFQAKDTLPELLRAPADLAVEAGVPDRPPQPVVQAPAQVARPGVSVARAPPAEEDLTNVGLVVPLARL